MVALNNACIRLLPRLFSYQIFVIAEPKPSLELLLQSAISESSERAHGLKSSVG
jgi:hypothetical protein